MSKKQETISDIVAEIRRENPEVFLASPWCYQPMPNKMRSYADRIEAAAKSIEADRDNWRRQALDEDARANAATIKESLTVGNASAMRNACANIAEYAKTAACHTEDAHLLGYLNQIERWAEAALDAPPRNCDGGKIMDYSNVRAVCFNCARKAGFLQKKKAVLAFEDDCDICKARRPCTDLHHDWIPQKKKAR